MASLHHLLKIIYVCMYVCMYVHIFNYLVYRTIQKANPNMLKNQIFCFLNPNDVVLLTSKEEFKFSAFFIYLFICIMEFFIYIFYQLLYFYSLWNPLTLYICRYFIILGFSNLLQLLKDLCSLVRPCWHNTLLPKTTSSSAMTASKL